MCMNIKNRWMLFCTCVIVFVSFACKEKKLKHFSAPVKSSSNQDEKYFEIIELLEDEKESNDAISAGFACYFQRLISSRLQKEERKI